MRRVGLVGAGFISRVHAEALGMVPGVQIAAVVDPTSDSAHSLARARNIPLVFASVRDALEADAFDCAHVLVPPELHAEVAAALIAAGKPVLVEKPLADTAAACAALMQHATVGRGHARRQPELRASPRFCPASCARAGPRARAAESRELHL